MPLETAWHRRGNSLIKTASEQRRLLLGLDRADAHTYRIGTVIFAFRSGQLLTWLNFSRFKPVTYLFGIKLYLLGGNK